MDIDPNTHLEFLLTTLDNLNDAILVVDNTGKVLYTNHGFDRIFKPLFGDIVEWTFDKMSSDFKAFDLNGQLLPPEQWPFTKILKGEKVFQEQLKINHNTDKNISLYIQVSGGPVKYAGEEQSYAIISVSDITAQQKSFRRLQESEEKLRLFIEHAPAALAMFDREMRYIAASKRWLEDNKVSMKEIIGAVHYDVVPDIPEEWKKIHHRGLNGESLKNDDDKFVREDGSIQYLKWEVIPWFNAEKEVGGIILVTEDITTRKTDEKEARVALTKYKTLFDNFPIGITVSDNNGRIIETNAVAEELLGISEEEQRKRHIDGGEWQVVRTDGTPMPVEEFANVRAITEIRKVENVEMGILKQDERITWINVTAAPIPLEEYGVVAVYSDISERKQYEEKLIESEKRFSNIFHDSPIPIAITRLADGEIILVNPSVTKFFGYTQEELIGSTTIEMGFWKDLNNRQQFIDRLQSLNSVIDMETSVVLKSGEKRHVLMWGELIEYYGEKCILLEIIDITEKKIQEEKIRLQNEKINAILYSLPDKLFIHDADGTFLEAYTTNPDGYIVPTDHFLGKNLYDVFPAEIAELNLSHLQECLQKKEPVSHEFTTDYKGTCSTFEVRIVPFMENLAIRFVRDITKTKENERHIRELNSSLERRIAERTAELQYNQDKLMLSQKISQMGIWEFNTLNDEVRWSDETYTIFERSPENKPYTFKEFLDSIYPEDQELFINSAYSMAGGENIITHTLRHYTDKGNLKWVKYYIKGEMKNGEAHQFLGTLLDITAEKERQLQLEKAVNEAEEANKAKSIFLANMSHEIRTPLNSIIGFSELLFHTIEDDKKRSQIASIRNSGQNLLRIINDILDLSKVEAGKLILEAEPLNVFQVAREVCSMFEPTIKEKKLHLTIESETTSSHHLLLDGTRLRQILFNLVGNAIKFTSEGGVTVEIHHEEKDEKRVDLEICIRDTGMGISEDQLESIFQPFVQQKGQGQKSYGGTGLGLTISRRLAEAMGGEISVTSRQNEGAAFTLIFRDIAISELLPEKQRENFDDYTDIRFEGRTILIADDIEENRKLLSDALEHTGAHLLMAENGQQAVERAEKEKPDLILMDIRMPVMDGREACKLLKKNPLTADIPCISLSATIHIGMEEDDFRQLFDDNIPKPIEFDQLFGYLKKYLAINRSTRHSLSQGRDQMTYNRTVWPDELKKYAKEELLPLYSRVMRTRLMDDTEIFGRKLEEAGRRFENRKLMETGKKIAEYAEQFEVDKLTGLLRELNLDFALTLNQH